MKNNLELVPEKVTQAIDKSWLNENTYLKVCSAQGPVVRRPISANLGLNFNPGSLFPFNRSIFSDNFLYSF